MSRVGPTEPVGLTVTGRRSVSDVLWLANTRHGPAGHWHARVRADAIDHDHLETAEGAVAYLVGHAVDVPAGLPSATELDDLRRVRDSVQALVPGTAIADLEPPLDGLGDLLDDADLALGATGQLASRRPGWNAFVRDLLVPAIAVAGQRDRLRRCDNPSCRLVFLDASRNRARRWCDDAGCSNRARVRRARSRARAA